MGTLTRRYVRVIASDRGYLTFMALLPVICACLAGAASSVRELVKERSIYIRERAAGLSSGAYLSSKLLVLGVIAVVQSIILVLIGLAGRPMPPTGAFLTGAPLV